MFVPALHRLQSAILRRNLVPSAMCSRTSAAVSFSPPISVIWAPISCVRVAPGDDTFSSFPSMATLAAMITGGAIFLGTSSAGCAPGDDLSGGGISLINETELHVFKYKHHLMYLFRYFSLALPHSRSRAKPSFSGRARPLLLAGVELSRLSTLLYLALNPARVLTRTA